MMPPLPQFPVAHPPPASESTQALLFASTTGASSWANDGVTASASIDIAATDRISKTILRRVSEIALRFTFMVIPELKTDERSVNG